MADVLNDLILTLAVEDAFKGIGFEEILHFGLYYLGRSGMKDEGALQINSTDEVRHK